MRKMRVCGATSELIPSFLVCVCQVQGVQLLQLPSSHQNSACCIVRITFSDFAAASNTVRLLLPGESLRLIEVSLSPESPARRRRDRQALVRPHGSHPVWCITGQGVDKEENKQLQDNSSSAWTKLKICWVVPLTPLCILGRNDRGDTRSTSTLVVPEDVTGRPAEWLFTRKSAAGSKLYSWDRRDAMTCAVRCCWW